MMSCSNASITSLLFLLIFFLKLSYCMGNNGIILCPEIEKQSLLILKQGLKDPDNLMYSWEDEVNCCNWKGVVCNNLTGHVHQLHLQGRFDNYPLGGLSGKIHSSLLNLKHLRYLDLSQNEFFGETIPSFIGSFANLEYLNLSHAGFHGKIPHNIGNLSSNLLFLDLSWNSFGGLFPSFGNLSNNLLFLDLSWNSFEGPIPSFRNLANSLLFLDLSWNSFSGPIPSINSATKLKHINLSNNRFNLGIPNWLYFCKDLEFVDLSFNLLEGTISNDIENLTSLRILYLEWNQLFGEIPKEIANLSKIEVLSLPGNKLHGEIPDSFTKLSSLKFLWLSGNNLTGNLPKSFGQLLNVEAVFIDKNSLSGVVTETHFANLTKLKTFSASENHLSLKVSPNWNPPIQLTSLLIGSWTLLGASNQIPSWLHKRSNISRLNLSNAGIYGNVPSWFWEVRLLNLSHNHLHGKIPYIRPHNIEKYERQYMYLSSNQFSGSLPQIGDGVQELDLSNNSFSGGISHLLCDTTFQSYNLRILHLGENQLSGELPNCWTKWPLLVFLSLGNNNMSGTIPNSIGFLKYLKSLNLYGNKFSGQIPSSLHNCTELVKIDFADNRLHGNIPTRMGTSLVKLRILILRSNWLSGELSSNLCQLNSLQILDLSSNRFSGIIPRCVFNFTAMAKKSKVIGVSADSWLYYSYSSFIGGLFMESVSIPTKGSELQYDTVLLLVTIINLSKNNLCGDIPKELASLVELKSLNLSENQLTGLIPNSIGDMKQLESLDLSRNILSGQIPNSFTHMSFLSYLNISYNNLTGRIPENTQLQSLDASSFIGNHLCGPPLAKNCSHDGSDGVHGDKDKYEDEDEDEIEWFLVFLSLGYALGLSAVCSALVLKKSWRDAYFDFLENMWNKFYVYVHIKWTRLHL